MAVTRTPPIGSQDLASDEINSPVFFSGHFPAVRRGSPEQAGRKTSQRGENLAGEAPSKRCDRRLPAETGCVAKGRAVICIAPSDAGHGPQWIDPEATTGIQFATDDKGRKVAVPILLRNSRKTVRGPRPFALLKRYGAMRG